MGMIISELARQTMVQTQLAPQGIRNEAILKAFATVPRQDFLPVAYQHSGYCDHYIPLGNQRYMMDCTTLARLFEAAALQPAMSALVIGANTGYAAVILSYLVSTVFALEEDKVFLKQITDAADRYSSGNILPIEGPLKNGLPEHAPYDFILIEGGVDVSLEHLYAQISPQGALGTVIIHHHKAGSLTLIKRKIKQVTSVRLRDAYLPPLAAFQQEKRFKF